MAVIARLPRLAGLVLLAWASASPAQPVREVRYTDTQTGADRWPLGFAPPQPVDSASPVDGFRSMDALHARHQELMLQHDFITGQAVGQTRSGEAIWAYALGDADPYTVNAGVESSAMVNGGLHAREWASPEVVTGLIEAYAAGVGDQWLYDFLEDNVHLVVVPVSNIDGLRQTQRYPARVLVGADPRFPAFWPRDGRMRRKNMIGADTELATLADHLAGVDLNRNNEPFWASSTSSSANPDSLLHHGPVSFSEPETQALLEAAEFARRERLRWYEDVHAFTQVFFSVNTFNARRNFVQSELLDSFSRFHDALSLARHGTGRWYEQRPDEAGVGIGTTSEYFAWAHEIPAWTLELEPRATAAEYGGFGAEHDGFILPESEVARVRDDMALTHAVIAYRQAGPPAVRRLEIARSGGEPVYSARWRDDGDGRRRLEVERLQPLLPGLEYRLTVAFDKPMRWPSDAGPAGAPGHSVAAGPSLRLVAGPFVAPLDSIAVGAGSGVWLDADGDTPPVVDYRFDAWRATFRVPRRASLFEAEALGVEIDAEDFTEQRLDADPATIADWVDGAWAGYEDEQGTAGDRGGPDRTLNVTIATPRQARRLLRQHPPPGPVPREQLLESRQHPRAPPNGPH